MDAFEAAVDATIQGDVERLAGLLRTDPELARARSARSHRASLLHYVAANGVEDERQVVPPNAVDVARTLLAAGADPDALACYGSEEPNCSVLGALVTSVHPARAGLQAELVELLVGAGASVDGVGDTGAPLNWAVAFVYPDAAVTLHRLGAVVPTVVEAAALGLVDDVRDAFGADGRLPADVRWCRLQHVHEGSDAVRDQAFVMACAHERLEVAELLLSFGASLSARMDQGFTALHHAAWYGKLDVLEWLLARGAPLEEKNAYGGTVIDGTVWGAANAPADDVDHVPIVERLLAAGADASCVSPFPSGHAGVDALLARHGLGSGAG